MPPLGQRAMEQCETLPTPPHGIMTPLVRAVVEMSRQELYIFALQRGPVPVTASGDEMPGQFHAVEYCVVAALAAKDGHRVGGIAHEDDALFRGVVEAVARDEDAPAEPVVHGVFLDGLGVQQRRERRYERLVCNLLEQLFGSGAGLRALRHPQRVVGALGRAGV